MFIVHVAENTGSVNIVTWIQKLYGFCHVLSTDLKLHIFLIAITAMAMIVEYMF